MWKKKIIPDEHVPGQTKNVQKFKNMKNLISMKILGELFGMHVELDRNELHTIFICSKKRE